MQYMKPKNEYMWGFFGRRKILTELNKLLLARQKTLKKAMKKLDRYDKS